MENRRPSPRRAARAAALVIALLSLLATPALAGPLKALVGGRLIDGYGGRPLDNSVIVIDGDRI